MLDTASMSRTALALVLLAASASAASAGTYLGLGIGTSPATSGDITMQEDGRSGRLQLGYRFGRLSVEGTGSRADTVRLDHPYSWTSLGVAGKLSLPLGDKFEAFGRLGYQHTSIEQKDTDAVADGSGIMFGGGFEYRLSLAAVTSASIFIDYTIARSSLVNDDFSPMEFSMTTRVWTLGATVEL